MAMHASDLSIGDRYQDK